MADGSKDHLTGVRPPSVLYQAAIDNLPRWFIQKIREDGASSCDWFCSDGDGTDLLAQRLKIKVTGLDEWAVSIDRAQRKYSQPQFLRVEDLSFGASDRIDEYGICFVINKLEHFANPVDVLTSIAGKARNYLVVQVPYREYQRPAAHASTFDQGNIPVSIAGQFTLIYSRVMAIDTRDGEGEHILLIYASAQEIGSLGLSLVDLEIGRELLRPAVRLQRLRDELKKANQLFLYLEQRLGASEGALREREALIAALHRSTSWRLTSPIRGLGQAARTGKHKAKALARTAYRHAPMPKAWKQALKRALVGVQATTPAGAAAAAPQSMPGVATHFVPPLRGTKGRADVFIWGGADWPSLAVRSQQIAHGLAELGHRTYFFSSRFIEDDQPGFQLEAVSADGLLNVVHLHVANPQSIHDPSIDDAMMERLKASLAMFVDQSAPTSIISLLQHPFWLGCADQVPNRRLAYDTMIDPGDISLAGLEGDPGLILSADDGQVDARDRARAIVQQLDQSVPPLVSVVLVTYNKLELTHACLHSLEKNTHYKNVEIIVVDNDSRDATPEYLKEWARRGENRRIILNADNRGFAAGNNQGLRIARGEYLVLLNNDTYVTSGWLGSLVRHLQRNSSMGIVGPVTNNIGNESRIDISYGSMDEMETAARRYTSSHMGETITLYTAAFFCVAFTREIYEKVGELDEAFGIGMFEDDDYCRRVQQLGYTVACAEDVFIHHHHSASFNLMGVERRVKLFNENRALYESKWGPWVPHTYRQGVGPVQ
ncbi:glycosyltransferase [Achromobacter xylosoxidans]